MKWFIKVFRHYADFSGRARRKEYWMFALFNVIFFYLFLFFVILFVGTGKNIEKVLPIVYATYYAVIALPALAVSVRRLHDIGKSGWMLLIGLIPVIGGIWLFVLMVTGGQESGNRYGENPKTSTDTFVEQQRLKSAGVTLTVAASISIVNFIANASLQYYYQNVWYYAQIVIFAAYILILLAGISLLKAKTIREITGKNKKVLIQLLIPNAIFLLLNVYNLLYRYPVSWLYLLSLLSIVLFVFFNLYLPQNKDLIRKAAIVVFVFNTLNILWFFYTQLIGNIFTINWVGAFSSLTILLPVAYIVVADAFYPRKIITDYGNVEEPCTDTENHKTTEIPETSIPHKPIDINKNFTLANLEKVRINTKVSDIVEMFGQPDFTMRAAEAFASFGFVPPSEVGKEYWTYKTPYGDLQVAVKDRAYVVSTSGLEYLIEKIKAELPEEKPVAAEVKKILKEDVRFSIDSFKPVVVVEGFTKEEAYQILDDYLSNNKPQKMNDDETELLKPLFMNLLMYFRNEANLFSKSGRGFGGICDACNGDISKDEFYLMGSWARCRKCALKAIVSNLDWNYYLGHITSAIGQVPPSIVSQAYDIKDKINKRRI